MPRLDPRILSPYAWRGIGLAIESFRSAEARDAGLPVVRPPIMSAKYSRSRWTAGSKSLLNGSKNMTLEKTRENTLNSASWFLRCITSCARTASTSSRSNKAVRPVETRTCGSGPPTAIATVEGVSTTERRTGFIASTSARTEMKSCIQDSSLTGGLGDRDRRMERQPYFQTTQEIRADAKSAAPRDAPAATWTPHLRYATMPDCEMQMARLIAMKAQKNAASA